MWELINQEIWREKVVPIMSKTSDFSPHSTIPLYISLYNEAVIGKFLFNPGTQLSFIRRDTILTFFGKMTLPMTEHDAQA